MHSMKLFLVLGFVLGVAFAEKFVRKHELHGDDLTAAKELLTRNIDKLPVPKFSIVTWFSTRSTPVSGTFYKYVVDVNSSVPHHFGSYQNECTFTIWQAYSEISSVNEISMSCQGGDPEVRQRF